MDEKKNTTKTEEKRGANSMKKNTRFTTKRVDYSKIDRAYVASVQQWFATGLELTRVTNEFHKAIDDLTALAAQLSSPELTLKSVKIPKNLQADTKEEVEKNIMLETERLERQFKHRKKMLNARRREEIKYIFGEKEHKIDLYGGYKDNYAQGKKSPKWLAAVVQLYTKMGILDENRPGNDASSQEIRDLSGAFYESIGMKERSAATVLAENDGGEIENVETLDFVTTSTFDKRIMHVLRKFFVENGLMAGREDKCSNLSNKIRSEINKDAE